MRRFLLAATAAVLVAVPVSAQVTTVGTGAQDSFLGPIGKDVGATTIAQTFLTPSGFNYLQAFSFIFADNFDGASLRLDASIYAFVGDHIDGPALFQSALVSGTSSAIGEAVKFGGNPEAPLNIPLTPGTTYALILSAINGFPTTPDGASILVGVMDTDVYADGAFFVAFENTQAGLLAPGAFVGDIAPDASFSASFSSAAVVATPEPATLTLLATGLAGLGGYVKRRKRAA